MKILPINFNINVPADKSYRKNKSITHSDCTFYKSIIPSASQVIAFYGGNSMNLKQTILQIDKYSSFPPGIRENAVRELEQGNPNNKTLIDIHRDKYSKLNEFETLDEVKAAFPEFSDVLSDTTLTDYKKNSFFDDVKSGRSDYFDPDVDLSLQLLRLYWGEGFSLADIKEKITGKYISGALEKLNIPRVDRLYGQYLKLSDKDYNKRFTAEMSERFKNTQRIRAEKREGVYIPRGPLSDEHKQKISQGLLRYYSENPEKIQEMSKRQVEFFQKNPREKDKFSQVLYRAWSYHEADSIRKKMSKFMSRKNITAEELANLSNPDSELQRNLKEFWKKNAWAAKQFSICMKRSWAHQNMLASRGIIYEPKFTYKKYPSRIAGKIMEYAGESCSEIAPFLNGIVLDDRDKQYISANPRQTSEKEERANAIMNAFFKSNENINDMYTDTIALTLEIVLSDLMTEYKTLTPEQKKVCNSFKELWGLNIAIKTKNNKPVDSDTIIGIYNRMIESAVEAKEFSIANRFAAAVEEAYKLISEGDEDKVSARTKVLHDDLAAFLTYDTIVQSHKDKLKNLLPGFNI